MRDYQTKFEKLLDKVGLLLQNCQVSHFISHLKHSLKADVLSASPTTLASAIGLARLHEDRNLSVPQFPGFPELKKLSTFTKETPSIGSGSSLLVKRLSPDEMQERRSKGLCYNYNEKFVPGYNCKKLFLLEVCEAEDDGDLVMDADHDTLDEVPEISLNVISGSKVPDTMRIRGNIESLGTIVLIDSGSTNNFVSEDLARKVGL